MAFHTQSPTGELKTVQTGKNQNFTARLLWLLGVEEDKNMLAVTKQRPQELRCSLNLHVSIQTVPRTEILGHFEPPCLHIHNMGKPIQASPYCSPPPCAPGHPRWKIRHLSLHHFHGCCHTPRNKVFASLAWIPTLGQEIHVMLPFSFTNHHPAIDWYCKRRGA